MPQAFKNLDSSCTLAWQNNDGENAFVFPQASLVRLRFHGRTIAMNKFLLGIVYVCMCVWSSHIARVRINRNFSIPCLPRERSTCTFGSILHFPKYTRRACSRSVYVLCVLSNSPSSLVRLVSGRYIVRDCSTVCAHDACCKTFFPKDSLALRARDTVYKEILKQE